MSQQDTRIDLKSDYFTFKKAVTEKYGDQFAKQTELFLARAAAEAEDGFLDAAITDAEFAYALSQYQPEEYRVIYLIGFLTQTYLDNNQISKARGYCELGFKMLDETSEEYKDDYRMFIELREMINGESWKLSSGL